MVLDLSKVTFDYDFFTSTMPDGNQLVLNKINEDFISSSKETEINGINIIVELLSTNESVLCSSVIGTSNDYIAVISDYEELQGKTLTTDNMKYCTLEMFEVENE